MRKVRRTRQTKAALTKGRGLTIARSIQGLVDHILMKHDMDGVLPFKETLGWKDFFSGLFHLMLTLRVKTDVRVHHDSGTKQKSMVVSTTPNPPGCILSSLPFLLQAIALNCCFSLCLLPFLFHKLLI